MGDCRVAEKKNKESILKKQIKKKLKKKIYTALGISNIGVIILGLIILSAFFVISDYENKGTSNISDIGAKGVPAEFVEYFNEASEMINIPNWVLVAVAKQESNFNPNAGYGGAFGMMQMQKYDIASGKDLWEYHINLGLGDIYKKNGYSFSSSEEMWDKYLKEPKVQIIAGAYAIRYYGNYVLYKNNKTENLNYNNSENMNLIDWKADENNSEFKDTLRRIFACYNGGPGYGMSVDFNNAHFDYPNKVFRYAMEFRNSGLSSNSNDVIENAIRAGEFWLGNSPYVWGGGRSQADVDAGRFDCSSFIHYMYASAGIQLGPRESAVTFSLVHMGKEVQPNEMKRGDMMFFDTYTIDGHIGVYLGSGNFIHDGPRGVEVGTLNNSYWSQAFNGKVRRVTE